jgi:hypothetical protein
LFSKFLSKNPPASVNHPLLAAKTVIVRILSFGAGVGLAVAFRKMRECFAGCSLYQANQSEWQNLSFSLKPTELA